ncbi:hypothetical protein HAX54_050353 [Datura stramonium]|uniref:Uncharacterized protein n=1 Tax=Datura stramonium TaxID=4076 RepID=A0ABS8SWA4_DATST|nr:hypothetical protein [Datura stramonium]
MNGAVDAAKKLRAEKEFLDQHFDNRHSNLLGVGQGDGDGFSRIRCMWALHCDLVMEFKSKTKCNPAATCKIVIYVRVLRTNVFLLIRIHQQLRLHGYDFSVLGFEVINSCFHL